MVRHNGARASQVALVVKNLSTNASRPEMPVQSLGQQDPLEKGMVTHCSIVACRNPMDRRAWLATVHRVTEWGMTEATEHAHLIVEWTAW